jgi:hypothetical protein
MPSTLWHNGTLGYQVLPRLHGEENPTINTPARTMGLGPLPATPWLV